MYNLHGKHMLGSSSVPSPAASASSGHLLGLCIPKSHSTSSQQAGLGNSSLELTKPSGKSDGWHCESLLKWLVGQALTAISSSHPEPLSLCVTIVQYSQDVWSHLTAPWFPQGKPSSAWDRGGWCVLSAEQLLAN